MVHRMKCAPNRRGSAPILVKRTRTSMPALLEARSLHAGYGETRVLHGIDFAVEQGGVTALLGANGAGKTTTLRAICGMVRTSGEIRLGEERIDGRATEDIVQRGVAHVP